MTMAAAWPTFMERVDPRWVMATTTWQAASISSLRPEASDPKTRQAAAGRPIPITVTVQNGNIAAFVNSAMERSNRKN